MRTWQRLFLKQLVAVASAHLRDVLPPVLRTTVSLRHALRLLVMLPTSRRMLTEAASSSRRPRQRRQPAAISPRSPLPQPLLPRLWTAAQPRRIKQPLCSSQTTQRPGWPPTARPQSPAARKPQATACTAQKSRRGNRKRILQPLSQRSRLQQSSNGWGQESNRRQGLCRPACRRLLRRQRSRRRNSSSSRGRSSGAPCLMATTCCRAPRCCTRATRWSSRSCPTAWAPSLGPHGCDFQSRPLRP